jgi:CheY-like chemotaxis protein/anti-sigma regulatory factor (Ser/Thr protein kinase)
MLAGGIAHDFNNILAALLGFTDLALDLAKEKDDEELSEYLNEVSIAGNRAKSLVRQILNFARKRDDALLPVRVDIIVKEVAKFLRSTIPTMIELKKSIDSSSTILANPVKIDQLVMNLCTNAAQAMEDGGKLEISLSDVSLEAGHSFRFKKDLSPGTYLCLEVKDNGTGIRPEIIERIFDPFFTTKPLGEGTGMGLAAVHSIVDDFGGDIAVESELGKGSSFTILLPIIEEEEEVLESEDQITPSTSSESILYVDDEMTICTLARRMLENQGYGVTSTTDALEALEHFKAAPEKFDLVITDMNMPKMAGDKLAGEILAIRPDIPVVIVSGYTEGMSLEQAEKIGVRAIISKPFESKEFTSLVHKVLDEA